MIREDFWGEFLDGLDAAKLTRALKAQADLRLRFGLIVLLCMLGLMAYLGPGQMHGRLLSIEAAAALYVLYDVSAYLASRRPEWFPPRSLLVATAILDPLILSLFLLVAGHASLLIVGFYLFTILGFGFRVGLTSMRVCQVASIVGLGTVALLSPIWREQSLFALSHVILLVVVPLYAGSLIRKLNAARESAEHASIAKSQLLAKVSHELRTPLTGIVSTASLIDTRATVQEAAERAKSIVGMAMGLDAEIKQLLDFSSLETSLVPPKVLPFRVRDLAADLERTLSPIALAKALKLTIEVDPAVSPSLLGDAQALTSALMNLAGNAVKFTAEGSVRVQIDLEERTGRSERVRFTVEDTGIGIAEEVQARIFEPFFQVETGPVRKFGGTGLGMSIAQANVRRMGGELSVRSALGQGSTFWFSLSLARVPALELAPTPQAPVVRPKRVLIADDHPSNLGLIAEMLKRDGHIVTAAPSGNAALEHLATADFDVVFLDFNMHDLDGATVYETYRFGCLHPAPTYFLTADTSALTTQRLETLGVAGIVHKPITFEKLRFALAAVFPEEGQAPSGGRGVKRAKIHSVPVEYVDPEAIERLREIRDTPEFIAQMLRDAVVDMERIEKPLSAALLAGDIDAVHREAHAMRGVAMGIGAVRVAAIAQRLMAADENELRASGRDRQSELHRAFHHSVEAIQGLRRSLLPAARVG